MHEHVGGILADDMDGNVLPFKRGAIHVGLLGWLAVVRSTYLSC